MGPMVPKDPMDPFEGLDPLDRQAQDRQAQGLSYGWTLCALCGPWTAVRGSARALFTLVIFGLSRAYFGPVLDLLGPVKDIFDTFGQIWTHLDPFGPI